jgi:hypothetical protein
MARGSRRGTVWRMPLLAASIDPHRVRDALLVTLAQWSGTRIERRRLAMVLGGPELVSHGR